MGKNIRSSLGIWPTETGQPLECRKRVLNSDEEEEIRNLPEAKRFGEAV